MPRRRRLSKHRETNASRASHEQYVLRLFITGMTTRSAEAIHAVKGICEKHLCGRCDLRVIDIYRQPDLAEDERVIATPTLIKKRPLPSRRFTGDLSRTDEVLKGLSIVRNECRRSE